MRTPVFLYFPLQHILRNALRELIHVREVHGGDIYALEVVVYTFGTRERIYSLADKLAVGFFGEVQPRHVPAQRGSVGEAR